LIENEPRVHIKLTVCHNEVPIVKVQSSKIFAGFLQFTILKSFNSAALSTAV